MRPTRINTLWDAVHAYVDASGGDPSAHGLGSGAQHAAADKVMAAVRDMEADARRAALEEAAKHCEWLASGSLTERRVDTLRDVAARIRALLDDAGRAT